MCQRDVNNNRLKSFNRPQACRLLCKACSFNSFSCCFLWRSMLYGLEECLCIKYYIILYYIFVVFHLSRKCLSHATCIYQPKELSCGEEYLWDCMGNYITTKRVTYIGYLKCAKNVY